ncbi:cationic amino acid transporter 2-like isoform X1 [Coccinella septempunctata]|uniref:cationic amino acid transporter 2-like isoform X1 n=2 Tax=Coccinella septempunctata TaxID=41139 RepID=UPI001D091FA1|nr:cationic amino acid transporter 2-like isoform X1 [Coccinella septempunctata]
MEFLEELGFDRTMYLKPVNWSSFKHALTRKKIVDYDEESKLSKVLSTVDLVALGIGSTLGAGIYVLAGDVARNTAGPAIVISFFIAAVASVLAGLCYAEFGARVPKAGSAYIYTYVCIGEFCAFIIGWNLILEYLIGSATVTKAIFTYLDKLTDEKMSDFFNSTVPIHADGFGNFTDLFSLTLAILFSVAIAFGVKESSFINNIFTLTNLTVVCTVIISGFWKADTSYWSIPKEKIPSGYGDGGFAPYGIKGIIKGAARCFFAFIGFDCIATAGEEAKNPQKSIPIGVVVSLIIVFLAYFGASAMITLMLPYYEQDRDAPLIYVYERMGWPVLKYLVSIGALCGLFASLLGAMFPLPRIIYAMASDGLIFRFLSKVHPKFHTPFMGTLVAGTIAGVLACLFDLEKLSSMMSIGTLFAYSMVAACVMVLRYSEEKSVKPKDSKEETLYKVFLRQIIFPQSDVPTKLTSKFVSSMIMSFGFLCLFGSGLLAVFEEELNKGEIWLFTLLGFIAVSLFLILLLVSLQPTSSQTLTFTVPLVPWIPGLSIMINTYLMTTLPTSTWIYYLCWMAIGLLIYFLYGFWNSLEGHKNSDTYPLRKRKDVESSGL